MSPRPWWLRLAGVPGDDADDFIEITREHVGFRRFPARSTRTAVDGRGRKWFFQLRARGVAHDMVGSLALFGRPINWLWHLLRYPGRWYLVVAPNRGDWPFGVTLPAYALGEFSSQVEGVGSARILNGLDARKVNGCRARF